MKHYISTGKQNDMLVLLKLILITWVLFSYSCNKESSSDGVRIEGPVEMIESGEQFNPEEFIDKIKIYPVNADFNENEISSVLVILQQAIAYGKAHGVDPNSVYINTDKELYKAIENKIGKIEVDNTEKISKVKVVIIIDKIEKYFDSK